jgi:hypothetical protein
VIHEQWPWPSRKNITARIPDMLFTRNTSLHYWLGSMSFVRSSNER